MTAEYDAVVYDLDGTLVRLNVDWDDVTADAATILSARGVDTEGMTLWDILEHAEENGYRGKIEERIAEHEREGARTSRDLPLTAELPAEVPVGVCSLNCEAACRIALEIHGIDSYVDAIVGRDTVASHKPDPEPLLEAIRALSVDPSRALFVGDTERDEETAQRAGVPFQYVANH
ncbi:MAG: phosphoglycolate phosphatase-like HAD superfamily hydrolase [Haloarculaceae archaeon]